MSARARNWRLEAVAWLAAIALVVGALAFSGIGDDESPPEPQPQPTQEAPAVQP
jgi:hypothetical protein